MHLTVPGNTKTWPQSSGSTPALKRVKSGFEPTSLIPGGYPSQRVLDGMESTTSYSGIPVKKMQQKNKCHKCYFQENSHHRKPAPFLSKSCHTGDPIQEVLKTLVTSENTEYEKWF